MTREDKYNIHKAIIEEKNAYIKDCNIRVAKEDGKIIGAEYITQRFLDILRAENEDDILKIIKDNCHNRFGCACCKYRNNETNRCRLAGVPCEWGLE